MKVKCFFFYFTFCLVHISYITAIKQFIHKDFYRLQICLNQIFLIQRWVLLLVLNERKLIDLNHEICDKKVQLEYPNFDNEEKFIFLSKVE